MRRFLSLTALVLALGLVVGPAANAGRPDFNPACTGTKIEPVESGTYALAFGEAAGTVTITVRETVDGPVIDFVTDSAGHVVTSVVVKGGPAYETYSPNASSGTDLHAPLNPSSGEWYGLSHLCLTTDDTSGGGEE